MTQDITYTGLALGFLLMLIPIYIFNKYKVGLVGSTLSATARMIIQMTLIGVYLRYLFKYDLWYINILWGLFMVAVASYTAVSRTSLKPSVLFIPIMASFFSTALFVSLFFLILVLRIDATLHVSLDLNVIFTARYFIPIFGLLLGNMLGVNVLSLTTYYEGIKREHNLYYFLLGNGATHEEATLPFIRPAIRKSFNPCIANMAVMGIVALPGTMIGQILGGSDPTTAVKYQLMIVVITFVASIISLLITIRLANTKSFDANGNLKDVFQKKA